VLLGSLNKIQRLLGATTFGPKAGPALEKKIHCSDTLLTRPARTETAVGHAAIHGHMTLETLALTLARRMGQAP
jgi:hypothetical protein